MGDLQGPGEDPVHLQDVRGGVPLEHGRIHHLQVLGGELVEAVLANARELAEQIRRGDYTPGQRLPHIRDLVNAGEGSKSTVHAAYKALEAEGLDRRLRWWPRPTGFPRARRCTRERGS